MEPKQALETLYNVCAQVQLKAADHDLLRKCRDAILAALEPKQS